MKKCSVEGCEKAAQKRQFCGAHYKRFWRHGDPLGGTASPGVPLAWIMEHASFDGDECLPWPFARGSDGRGGLYYQGQMSKPANVMCEIAHGPRPDGGVCAHSCGQGNIGCCNPRHLRWTDQAGNEADKLLHGTSNRGERNGMRKLRESDVIEIYAATGSEREIGLRYGVGAGAVHSIKNGLTWAWLTGHVRAHKVAPRRARRH